MVAHLSDKIPFYITIFFIIFLSSSFFFHYVIPQSSLIAGLLHLVLGGMLVWSLIALAKSDPGYVKNHVNFREADQESGDPINPNVKNYMIDASMPLLQVHVDESPHQRGEPRVTNLEKITKYRYCNKCNYIKPPRAHHCSVCDQCVMKMDHHCPFVDSCIGHGNHKLFWNFLMYASISAGQIAVCLLFLNKGDNETFGDKIKRLETNTSVFLAATLSLAISVSTGMMFWMHTWMILTNRTTIENTALMRENPFNKGVKYNWVEVFGEKWLYRVLIPVL